MRKIDLTNFTVGDNEYLLFRSMIGNRKEHSAATLRFLLQPTEPATVAPAIRPWPDLLRTGELVGSVLGVERTNFNTQFFPRNPKSDWFDRETWVWSLWFGFRKTRRGVVTDRQAFRTLRDALQAELRI